MKYQKCPWAHISALSPISSHLSLYSLSEACSHGEASVAAEMARTAASGVKRGSSGGGRAHGRRSGIIGRAEWQQWRASARQARTGRASATCLAISVAVLSGLAVVRTAGGAARADATARVDAAAGCSARRAVGGRQRGGHGCRGGHEGGGGRSHARTRQLARWEPWGACRSRQPPATAALATRSLAAAATPLGRALIHHHRRPAPLRRSPSSPSPP
uniref:Uncharacterized protein n=1 Tax=Oryza sativa subsp. japonica TaxID=39947 RepID=Q94LF8_ORYSJ|nr:Unknown protein [Oryza sativa Japonica Group]